MNILITGAGGFMGKNLTARLAEEGGHRLFCYDLDTDPALLSGWCGECDFVYHLAGVNRPKSQEEFMAGNYGFTDLLLKTLKKCGNRCPVMLSSSIQAMQPNLYGRSKKAGEELLFQYGRETGAPVYVFRFPNVFGKWSRPNYNSAVATFCYNIARDLPITVNDRATEMTLLYIDDLVDALSALLQGETVMDGPYCAAPVTHRATLGFLADALASFRSGRTDRMLPDMGDPLIQKLYATYLSFLPEEGFAYPLEPHEDDRGSFTEFLRSPDRGQVSVNVSRPGVVRGNHYHHTKNEKFLVVSGEAVIRFRRADGDRVVEYRVSGGKPEVVDIPPGYTHNIENVGNTDLITLMWASELYDPAHSDTHHLEV